MIKRLSTMWLLVALSTVGFAGAALAAGSTVSADTPIVVAADATDAPTTDAPPDTDAPATTSGNNDDGGGTADDVNWTPIIIVVAIILLLIVLFSMIVRGSRPKTVVVPAAAPQPQAPPGPSAATADWTRRARSAYATTRWIHDSADADLAAWKHAELVNPGSITPSDPRFQTWRDLEHEMSSVTSQLYALEADAPSGVARTSARTTGAALRGLTTALDTRIKLGPDASAQAISDAGTSLETERGRVSRALDDLADAIRTAT